MPVKSTTTLSKEYGTWLKEDGYRERSDDDLEIQGNKSRAETPGHLADVEWLDKFIKQWNETPFRGSR